MDLPSGTIDLIIRGDDTGTSASANRAVVQCYWDGPLRNTSVMGVGDALDDAARRFVGCRELSIGLHVTLNSEWRSPRYRPVLPPDRVASLVGPDGFFHPTPVDLSSRGLNVDEAMAEVRAQLARIRAAGLNPAYLDEHMGVGWVGGLADRLAVFAESEGLVVARGHACALPTVTNEPGEDRVAHWLRRIDAATPGRYVLITHPLFDDAESRAIECEGSPAGTVAAARDVDRRSLIDPRMRALMSDPRIRIARYSDRRA